MPTRSRRLMTFRVTTERNTSTQTDPLGQPTVEYTVINTNLPCYIWSEEERRNPFIPWNSNVSAAYERTKGIMPKGTDVKENDLLTLNTDRQGNTYMSGRYIIRGINPRHRDHLELYLERYDLR